MVVRVVRVVRLLVKPVTTSAFIDIANCATVGTVPDVADPGLDDDCLGDSDSFVVTVTTDVPRCHGHRTWSVGSIRGGTISEITM